MTLTGKCYKEAPSFPSSPPCPYVLHAQDVRPGREVHIRKFAHRFHTQFGVQDLWGDCRVWKWLCPFHTSEHLWVLPTRPTVPELPFGKVKQSLLSTCWSCQRSACLKDPEHAEISRNCASSGHEEEVEAFHHRHVLSNLGSMSASWQGTSPRIAGKEH